MARIALEGIAKDIVPLTRDWLRHFGHSVVYETQDPYTTDMESRDVDLLLTPDEMIAKLSGHEFDLLVLCNARGYLPFLEAYSRRSDKKQLIVITGGGPDCKETARNYTPFVLSAPYRAQELEAKVNEALNSSDKS